MEGPSTFSVEGSTVDLFGCGNRGPGACDSAALPYKSEEEQPSRKRIERVKNRNSLNSMPQFDEKKAYASQEATVFFDDGREIELLHFVYSRPNIEELRGNPEKVLAAIDEYGRTKKYLMNVGEDKGKIVTDLIAERKPKTMVRHASHLPHPTCKRSHNGRSSSEATLVTLVFSSAPLSVPLAVHGTTVSNATPSSPLSSRLSLTSPACAT